MAIFIGETCPVCQKAFAETDDVVVCPICGAPHHRQCYREKGVCHFQSQHDQGYVWKNHAQNKTVGPTENDVVCLVCGENNPPETRRCQHCGNILEESPYRPGGESPPESAWHRYGESVPSGSSWAESPGGTSYESGYRPDSPFSGFDPNTAYMAAMGGVSPEMDFQGVSARDLAIYIGDRSHYFLPRFAALQNDKKAVTFNIPAFLLGFPYFFYRKMYKEGLIFFALFALLRIPELLLVPQTAAFMAENFGQFLSGVNVIEQFVPSSTWISVIEPLLPLASLIIRFGAAILANQLYYRTCLRNIRQLRTKTRGESAVLDDMRFSCVLAQRGRTSIGAALVSLAAFGAAYFGVTYILMLPYMPQMIQSMMG